MVHLSFLVRKLSGAVSAGLVDHRRRHDFGISGNTSFIKEEIDEGPLQTGAIALVDRETCTGNLHTEVEVDEVIVACQFPMRQTCTLDIGIHVPVAHTVSLSAFAEVALHHQVIGSGNAFRNQIVGDIGNGVKELCALVLSSLHGFFELCRTALQFCHTGLLSFCLFTLALLHKQPYAFGNLVLFGQHSILFHLCRFTTVVDFKHFFYRGAGIGKMLLFQSADDGLFVVNNLFYS